MPRGKAKSDEEKLQDLDRVIAETEAKKASLDTKIKNLKAQKQAISNAQKQKKLEELQEIICKTGTTPDELLSLLKKKEKAAK